MFLYCQISLDHDKIVGRVFPSCVKFFEAISFFGKIVEGGFFLGDIIAT
jgi:hypothetical protein